MNNIIQVTSAATINIGPPAVILIVNPYMLYFAVGMFFLTCSLVCINIIGNCKKRNKRLDAIMTRAIRRAHAKRSGGSGQ